LRENSELAGLITRSVVRRVNGMATHPIEFGTVVAATFPLALHRAIYRRSRLSTLIAVVVGLAIPLSVSRTAIVTVAVSSTVLFMGWPVAWRKRFIYAAPIAVVIVRLAAPGVVGTIRSLFSNIWADPSTTGRTDDYSVVFDLVSQRPWFGRGLYTFVPRYYRILDNQLLMFLLELGVIGLAAFAALGLTAFCSARGARRRALRAEDAHLGLAISASIAGLLVSYATWDALSFSMAAALSFVLFGLAGAAWCCSTRSGQVPPPGILGPP
jgi:O-antigen ligase